MKMGKLTARLTWHFENSYVYNGVTIDKPHDSGTGMTCHANTKSGPFALFNRYSFREAYEDWGFLGFQGVVLFLGNT